MRHRSRVSRHSGPLPSPRELGEYEAALPGLAAEIVGMAKAEQAHRHKQEELALKQPYDLARMGQGCGLVALVFLAALAAYFAYKGAYGWAAAVGVLDIGAIVTVFVTGHAARGRASDTGSEEEDEDEEDDQD
ncbi:DUF2335 domain-containing protein [Streptomyces sp. BF23-19]|uniref:DUF2335 domain-containing protein n=1 Tax=unclassified Streptomyces TaxID=2593676 RepID=UPI0034E60525